MKRILITLTAILCCLLTYAAQSPVKWNISCTEVDGNGEVTLTAKATIEDGWHIYNITMPADGPLPTTLSFPTQKNAKTVGATSTDKPAHEAFEPSFQMNLSWFEKEVTLSQKFKVNDPDNYQIGGHIEYMACNDNTCLPPLRENFSFGKQNPKTTASRTDSHDNKTKQDTDAQQNMSENIIHEDTNTTNQLSPFAITPLQTVENTDGSPAYWKPVIEEMKAYGEEDATHTGDGGLWSVFLIGLLGGFLAILTPCVWPIIPMTVSFFLKRSDNANKGKLSAIAYGLSIIIIYVGLGLLITALFGADALNALSTNAIFNLFIFLLLILFATSFLGGFDLSLPASWSTSIDSKADKTAGILGILLMAFTLVIVSFSCTGPIIGTLLVHVSTGGNILAPTIGMLGFALALAVPFSIFAFFPNLMKKLPRSGSWLNMVKVLLGFFELAFSLKFLSIADLAYGWHILDREVFLVLWIIIFTMAGLYLLGKIRFKGDSEVGELSVPRFFSSIFVLAFALYLVPGLFGAPLKAISAFAPPIWTQDFNLNEEVRSEFTDFDEAMVYARRQNKPVVVDFSGYGCVNCRKMEAAVWNNPQVASMLTNDYVLVSLFMDDKTSLEHPITVYINGNENTLETIGEKWSYLQQTKFGANAMPFYVLLDNEGNALNHSFAFSEDANEFRKFLETGLKNYRK